MVKEVGMADVQCFAGTNKMVIQDTLLATISCPGSVNIPTSSGSHTELSIGSLALGNTCHTA